MVIESGGMSLLDIGLEQVIEILRPFFVKVSFIVGGIFGLYFILIVVRIYYERKKIKLLQCIRYDLDRMNMHKGISYSTQKKGPFQKLIRYLRDKFRTARVEHGFKKMEKKRQNKTSKK